MPAGRGPTTWQPRSHHFCPGPNCKLRPPLIGRSKVDLLLPCKRTSALSTRNGQLRTTEVPDPCIRTPISSVLTPGLASARSPRPGLSGSARPSTSSSSSSTSGCGRAGAWHRPAASNHGKCGTNPWLGSARQILHSASKKAHCCVYPIIFREACR